jgi:hypothetical protein
VETAEEGGQTEEADEINVHQRRVLLRAKAKTTEGKRGGKER